jgi:hypothetical protein
VKIFVEIEDTPAPLDGGGNGVTTPLILSPEQKP